MERVGSLWRQMTTYLANNDLLPMEEPLTIAIAGVGHLEWQINLNVPPKKDIKQPPYSMEVLWFGELAFLLAGSDILYSRWPRSESMFYKQLIQENKGGKAIVKIKDRPIKPDELYRIIQSTGTRGIRLADLTQLAIIRTGSYFMPAEIENRLIPIETAGNLLCEYNGRLILESEARKEKYVI